MPHLRNSRLLYGRKDREKDDYLAKRVCDFYDVLVERDKRAATVITSNRAVDEWVALFDDPILANSALDRFAHRAHQIVMDGPSLRAARAPNGHRRRGETAR